MTPSAAPSPVVSSLAAHVAEGLRRAPKTLSSMYLYDDAGSELFQQIMGLPEYYPTRAEYGIFAAHGAAIAAALDPADAPGPLALVELGAGDGLKTKLLLRELLSTSDDFSYVPVDISPSALAGLAASLAAELPGLRTTPVATDYATALAQLAARPGRKAVLFLGSNIGNFAPTERAAFLAQLAAPLAAADRLLVGFDLQKDPRRIRAAYDDAQGVTAAFNLNLLTRLNRELAADFDLAAWQHYTDYDPLTGAVRSYLVSTRAQTVRLGALDQSVHFAAWEVIHTENSYKFTHPQIAAMAAAAGLRVVATFDDGDFADVVLARA
ncbi:L-histidine N(alpha)-methyltransferase [Hymenobacter sp. PAMC 26628]|uniref:L-histidine N(alpha)-methyltransferase n=1 Tax=Hymenobacter sp. PAMC 26628 TaxID=1484118 RepID=UPI00076FEC28|nr:L-histidine N(alpha)-methyltransferase [Hymenobacter sp. PAMC 26628]AMJ66387.1 hypothetical protein AXW84_13805 [Hymenobacter sp. PAMC 26628]